MKNAMPKTPNLYVMVTVEHTENPKYSAPVFRDVFLSRTEAVSALRLYNKKRRISTFRYNFGPQFTELPPAFIQKYVAERLASKMS